MAIEAISQETLEQTQQKLKAEFSAGSVPSVGNTAHTVGLETPDEIEFRGRMYKCDPVSFQVGCRAQEILFEILQNRKENTDNVAYVRLCMEAMRLVWDNLTPKGAIARVLKRLRLLRNPFLMSSDGEVQQVLSFFFNLRMQSSVRFTCLPHQTIPVHPSTS